MKGHSRFMVVVPLLASAISVCLFTSCSSDKSQEASLESAAKKITRSDMKYFEDKKWVVINYDTNGGSYLHLIRCVEVGDRLAYPVMIGKYNGYTGTFGGVEAHSDFVSLTERFQPNEGWDSRSRIWFPLDQTIKKHVLFVKAEEVDKEILPETEWSYYELIDTPGESIQIPNVTKLPRAKDNKKYHAFLDKCGDAERALDSMRPDK